MAAASVDGKCPRCLQPARAGAARCAHCGERIPASPQRLLLLLGVVGVLVLAAVIGLSLLLPPIGEERGGHEQQQERPAPPPKKPPLD